MKRVLVVGASLGGLRTVEALRRLGHAGEIVWIGDEAHAPYDRPPLSKEILRGAWEPEKTQLRKEGLASLRVDFRQARAEGLDLARREVTVGAERIGFDGLVIATGARPRRLPGTEGLAGVHVLRTLDDALAIRAALADKPKLAVIGAGFIGAEVASSARSLGLDVTVIEALKVPLSRQLGERMGAVCAALHEENGVALRTGVGVQELEGEGRVRGVRLADGSLVEADLVVVGIGVQPNVEWLSGSGVQVGDGVECDEACRVLDMQDAAHGDIVAVGDVASFYNPLFGERMRVEHWTHTVEQAEHAAKTLLGDAQPFSTAPLFWSDQYGIKIQFAGRAREGDEIHIGHGNLEEKRFVALYGRAGVLVGALAFKRPAQLVKYRGLIEQRAPFAEVVSQAI
jgi:3-phenylpropionate/trans-cinnamate dioxygenase ferredoxin reductase subunit